MNTNKKANNYQVQKERALKRKWELIQKFGGKCQTCGYNKNLAALEFHHIDPTTKSFPVDIRNISNMKLELLLDEAKKCQLLCSNCHRELHNPSYEINNVINSSKSIQRLSFNNPSGQVCLICQTRFKKAQGKIYCSNACFIKSKNYPSLSEINEQYDITKSWEKVAEHFNITRRVTQWIRKFYSNQ